MSATATSNEPIFALPTRWLLLSAALAALLVGAAWLGGTLLTRQPTDVQWSGLIGVGVVLIVNLFGILMIMPWRARPMSMWMTLWIACTGFRLLVTPAILFLLYSAAPREVPVKPLVLSVALTYLVMVLAEAGTMASHVRRSLPSR